MCMWMSTVTLSLYSFILPCAASPHGPPLPLAFWWVHSSDYTFPFHATLLDSLFPFIVSSSFLLLAPQQQKSRSLDPEMVHIIAHGDGTFAGQSPCSAAFATLFLETATLVSSIKHGRANRICLPRPRHLFSNFSFLSFILSLSLPFCPFLCFSPLTSNMRPLIPSLPFC